MIASNGSSIQTDFLTGGGDMAVLIRDFDWSETPLGAVEAWPSSLKTSVGLILSSRHPMWIGWGPAMTFLYNDAYLHVLGPAKHPWALGRPTSEVWPEIWDICGPLARKVFEKGEATFVDDVQFFMNRGEFLEETFYSFSYSPIRDESGSIGGLFCPSTDVTPKILNARRLRTLSDLAANALAEKTIRGAGASVLATLAKNPADIPFAILYLADRDGAHASLVGHTPDAAIPPVFRPPIVDLNPDLAGSLVWPIAEAFATGRWQQLSVPSLAALPRGGADQPVTEAIVFPVSSGSQVKPIGILIMGLNPTRKLDLDYQTFFELVAGQAGTVLHSARAAEEERVRADRLAEIDRAKTLFFSNISHEFRTPLTLILGPLEALLEKSELSRGDRGQIATAHRNSLRLLRLVNSLLDFSRIEAGRMKALYLPTDIAALTADLASNFRSAMEAGGLEFIVDCPPMRKPVYLDQQKWEDIVINLLSNAFKFTFEGRVAISLRSVDNRAVLTVEDNGTGIPEHELPHIFDRFHRVEGARGRTHEGTGIGLALIQELVKLHGGTVDAASRPGQGSRFTVTIPFGSAHLPQDSVVEHSPEQSIVAPVAGVFSRDALGWLVQPSDRPGDSNIAAEQAGPRPRILVAEDNADMRQHIFSVLGPSYDLIGVADGRAALAEARETIPDIILSDVMMPHLDGFGLLEELRSDARLREVPVILLSARAGEEASTEGITAGADDYLIKPFSARELTARVRRTLDLQRIRREAREEIARSEDRFRAYVTASSDVVYRMSSDWREMQYLNGRNFLADTQNPSVTWLSKYIHPDDQEMVLAAIAEATRSQTTFQLRHRVMRADGTLGWMHSRAVPLLNAEGEIVEWFGAARDVTEQEEAENKLRETQKLESLGVLAGGIAHDFNNLLTGMLGNASLLAESLRGTSDEPIAEALIEVSERMARLTQQMLSYSGRGRFVTEPLSLSQEVTRIAALIHASIPRHVDLQLRLTKDLPAIEADASQIQQVIMNLVINAAEAIGVDGGAVEVTTYSRELSDGKLEGNLLLEKTTPGLYVALRVADNGCGMDEATRRKIFDPFFTTKFSGRGLGLSAALGVVRGHKGLLAVNSTVGRGTTFTVLFPASMSSQVAASPLPENAAAISCSDETVLIVDDEETVLRVAQVALSKAGYRVLLARNGQEAVQTFRAKSGEIDLVLLDLTMPVMGGAETLRRLKEIKPDAAVIGSSGYDESNAASHFGAGVAAFLQKPYKANALTHKVATILAQRAASVAASSAGPWPAQNRRWGTL